MKILSLRTIHGPNVYHRHPVIVMKIDLQQWAEVGSHEIPDLKNRLLSELPGLNQHTCSPGYVGGFVERVERGTYPAHIIEHVAIELSCLAGMPITYGKTRFAGNQGQYNVVVRFLNEEAMKLCLRNALKIVQAILEKQQFSVTEILQAIKDIRSETDLGPSGSALLNAACKRGIPVRRLSQNSLLQLGYGIHRKRVQAAVSSQTSVIATELVQDKHDTKKLLTENGVPVPFGLVCDDLETLKRAMVDFAGPYAIKPADGHHGEGVSLNLQSEEEVCRGFAYAQKFSRSVIVEEMCGGKDFRVLVVGGKFSAAAERIPPRVIGDGQSTIAQLIENLNLDPLRGAGHCSMLSQITVDSVLTETLLKQGFSLQTQPALGQKVCLKENANLSSGGTAVDVTLTVHSEIRRLCERIARIVDLDICGIDIMAESLAVSRTQSGLKVIEVNAGPGLRMHLSPSEGVARNVADDIMQMLYSDGNKGRIPIAAVTGTNGKTTTVRLIHKILSQNKCVGMTTSDGVFIGNDVIETGDMTGPYSSNLILSDSSVEMAVLELARGGLLRGGLAYDESDVGIVTNIRPDHIGQDGIEDIEDLVWIKALVAESVKENGILVLNADDEQSYQIQFRRGVQKSPKKFVFYSVTSTNQRLLSHLKIGGDGCWVDDTWIFYQENNQLHRLISVRDLPLTLNGRASFQISNVLAAVAGSRGMGASWEQIVKGLKSFSSNLENKGRMNMYKIGEGYLILDYGHNPDAIVAMGDLLSQWQGYHKTAVFGLPGDRADHILEMSAKAVASSFDRLIIRDDLDLRGRRSGEVPELICRAARTTSAKANCELVLDEAEALHTALKHLKKNEIVVVFYDVFQAVLQMLRQYDPIPVETIPTITLDHGSSESRGGQMRPESVHSESQLR